jgi:hypothetical protein
VVTIKSKIVSIADAQTRIQKPAYRILGISVIACVLRAKAELASYYYKFKKRVLAGLPRLLWLWAVLARFAASSDSSGPGCQSLPIGRAVRQVPQNPAPMTFLDLPNFPVNGWKR